MPLDENLQVSLENLYSQDRELQNQVYSDLLTATEKPVDWAYQVWDELVAGLSHRDNHVRAIASQVLCNLAKSDPDYRLQTNFEALLEVTRDARFVTARHCLQALWKVGAAGPQQQALVLGGLERRFNECIAEKNCTLIRFDIIQGLKNLFDEVEDETIRMKALTWIGREEDLKYRKKYARVWK
jgi:hypothetical protein